MIRAEHSLRFLNNRSSIKRLTPLPSINSGSLKNDGGKEQDRKNVIAGSLIGEDVHGTINARNDKIQWGKLYDNRQPFSTPEEAIQQLMQEASRRDPFQSHFLEALKDVAEAIIPLIRRRPLEAWVMKQLIEPESFATFRISWRDDYNNWRMNRGYRLQYSSVLGSFQGPYLFDCSLTHSSVRMLGFEQVMKNALLLDSQMGGGFCGADLDMRTKSPSEENRFNLAFQRAMNNAVGTTDCAFERATTNPNQGAFAAMLVRHACERFEPSLKGKTCIISGKGEKSVSLARQLVNQGAIPISFSDDSGFLLKPTGFTSAEIRSLEGYNRRGGRLKHFTYAASGTFHVSKPGESLWSIAKGDLAFPCMASGEISSHEACKLAENGCKGVFEMYDRACSEHALLVLKSKNVLFAPSKLMLAAPLISTAQDLDEYCRRLIQEITFTARNYGYLSNDLKAGSNILAFNRLSLVISPR